MMKYGEYVEHNNNDSNNNSTTAGIQLYVQDTPNFRFFMSSRASCSSNPILLSHHNKCVCILFNTLRGAAPLSLCKAIYLSSIDEADFSMSQQHVQAIMIIVLLMQTWKKIVQLTHSSSLIPGRFTNRMTVSFQLYSKRVREKLQHVLYSLT